MRIRTKVAFASAFFIAVAGAVGVWCHINIKKEEEAFAKSRRAARAQEAVTDIEYFLVRKVRAVQNFVLLGDEAESLQSRQAETQIQTRLAQWTESAARAQADGAELPAARRAYEALHAPIAKVEEAMASGRRSEAMRLVEEELGSVAPKALGDFKDLRLRAGAAADAAEERMVFEVRRNHSMLLAGLGLVTFFGLVFLVSFYKSVIRPVQIMQDWANRVAAGDKNVPWQFPGRNEMTELAASIGEMAIELARPRAVPAAATQAIAATAVREVPPEAPAALRPSPETKAAPMQSPGTAGGARGAETPAGGNGTSPLTPPPAPDAHEFDRAVEGFREILAQMGGYPSPKSRKIG